MTTHLMFVDFILLLLSTVIIYDRPTAGTTTTQRPEEATTSAYTTQSLSCDEPCENCTTDGQICLQRCPDGSYYVNDTTTTTMSETTTTTTAAPEGTARMVQLRDQGPMTSTTNHSNGTELHPLCRKCVEAIPNCEECFQNQLIVYCSSCSSGHTISNNMKECTMKHSSDSDFPAWVIAVIVVGSVLILAGAGVAIFFVVRRYKGKKSRAPPPLPAPGII